MAVARRLGPILQYILFGFAFGIINAILGWSLLQRTGQVRVIIQAGVPVVDYKLLILYFSSPPKFTNQKARICLFYFSGAP